MKKLLKNKKILITAGPTREYLDPVRYISNDSSGKMGYALATAAKKMGASVTLISGPTHLKKPAGLNFISVVTARDMKKETLKKFKKSDIAICAAAVADFSPISCKNKIKKHKIKNIKFTRNPDILALLGKKKKSGQTLIGFALETENIRRNSVKKLKEKNCDIIIANSEKNIGSDIAEVDLVWADGTSTLLKGTKTTVAEKIIKEIVG